MIRFSLLFVLITACNTLTPDDDKGDQRIVEKRFDYRITVNTWNGFFGHESKFILDNSLADSYDSTHLSGLQKPFTLYYISFEPRQQKNSRELTHIDTTETPFSRDLSDTLFLLTKAFFKSLEFNNYDTVGQLTPIITDDSHGLIELYFRGRRLSATISSINNPSISTKELDTLRSFVNKFKPVH